MVRVGILAALVLLVTFAGCTSPATTGTSTPAAPGDSTPATSDGSTSPATSAAATGCSASPSLTIGPYYLDAKDRSDVRSGSTSEVGSSSGDAAGEHNNQGDPENQGDDNNQVDQEAQGDDNNQRDPENQGHYDNHGDQEAVDEAQEAPTAEYVDVGPRSNIKAGSSGSTQEGAPLTLTIMIDHIVKGECVALAGAKVDIWHANAQGHYSGFSQEGTAGEDWLRGWQTTGSDGKVTFTTIWPGWYPGRAVHIHVRVRHDGADFTSQFFFDEAASKSVYAENAAYTANGKGTTPDTANSRDGIYNQGGNRMILVTGGSGSYTGSKTVVVPA